MGVEDAPSKLRTFIAIPFDTPVLAHLEQAQQRLRHRLNDPALRWTAAGGLHLTLKFLGATRPETVPDLARALQRDVAAVPRFAMRLGSWGAFPSLARPRVVWVATSGDEGGLAQLHLAVQKAAQTCGFGGDDHPFSPHITVARVRDGATPDLGERLRAALGGMADPGPVPPVPVHHVVLYRSTLTPRGAHYDALAQADLGEPAGD